MSGRDKVPGQDGDDSPSGGGNGGGKLLAGISESQSRQLFVVLAIASAAGAGLLTYLLNAPLAPGRFGEDALDAAGALALAGGHGLSFQFGPEAVAATRLPPLLPILLVPAVWLGAGQIGEAAGWMHLLAAGITFAFVLLAYGALRRVLGLSPVVSFAAAAGLALHPVVGRFGGAIVADTLAGALALAALVVAARVEDRIEARAWEPPEERLQVPVVLGAEGPVVIGPGGLFAGGTPGADTEAGGALSAVPGAEAGQLAGIAVILRSVPPERKGLARIWHGWGLADWWPVGLLAALAVLARYEAIAAAAAIGLALATRRRWREAAGLIGFTALLVLPWAAWAVVNWEASAAAPHFLENVPSALWQGLGRVLPGFLIPQAFMAGYPLGAEGAPHMAGVPAGVVAVWGLLVSVSLAGPLWRLRNAASVAARAGGFFALGTLLITLASAGLDPAAGWDFMARSLLPAAPFFVGAVWMWKAGEHRFERAAAERFKGLIALGWVAAVILFAPISLGPVREDAKRAVAYQTEQVALWRAIGELTAPDDVIAAIRPAAVWLHSGRHAVSLPVAAPDLPEAVRQAGAAWVVSEPLPVGGRDAILEALTKASAAEPDWARLVYASPGRKVALFQVLRSPH